LVSVHLAGEGKDEISLRNLPGKFAFTRTKEVLAPCGGPAAWSGFPKHLGITRRISSGNARDEITVYVRTWIGARPRPNRWHCSMAAKGEWRQAMKGGYEQLRTGLATIEPQLESQGDGFGLRSAPAPGAAALVPGDFLRQIAPKTRDVPPECLARRSCQPAFSAAPRRRARSGAPHLFVSYPSHRHPVAPSEKQSTFMPARQAELQLRVLGGKVHAAAEWRGPAPVANRLERRRCLSLVRNTIGN